MYYIDSTALRDQANSAGLKRMAPQVGLEPTTLRLTVAKIIITEGFGDVNTHLTKFLFYRESPPQPDAVA